MPCPVVAHWTIEDIARLRLFRRDRRKFSRSDVAAFAASIGRSEREVREVMKYLPYRLHRASPAMIDDGPLTHAERMALIWAAE